MRGTGIGHAADIVDVLRCTAVNVILCKDRAISIAHHFNVDVIRIGVTVIRPEEGTDPKLIARRSKLFDAVRRDLDDLAWAELAFVGVTELAVRE